MALAEDAAAVLVVLSCGDVPTTDDDVDWSSLCDAVLVVSEVIATAAAAVAVEEIVLDTVEPV